MVLGVSVGFECLATRIHRLLVRREPKMPKIIAVPNSIVECDVYWVFCGEWGDTVDWGGPGRNTNETLYVIIARRNRWRWNKKRRMYGIEWCPIINTVYSVHKTSNKRGRYDIFQIFTVTYSAHQLNHPPAIRKWYINKPSKLGWCTFHIVSPGRWDAPKTVKPARLKATRLENSAPRCVPPFVPPRIAQPENTLSLRLGGWLVCYGMMSMWVGLIGGRFSQFVVADSWKKTRSNTERRAWIVLGAKTWDLSELERISHRNVIGILPLGEVDQRCWRQFLGLSDFNMLAGLCGTSATRSYLLRQETDTLSTGLHSKYSSFRDAVSLMGFYTLEYVRFFKVWLNIPETTHIPGHSEPPKS